MYMLWISDTFNPILQGVSQRSMLHGGGGLIWPLISPKPDAEQNSFCMEVDYHKYFFEN